MTMPVSLIKVGNSNAIIIPSKVLKRMNLKGNTKFELSLEGDSTIQIKKVSSDIMPAFPKIAFPKVTKREMEIFYDGLTKFDSAQANEDDRLSYILER